MNNVQTTVISQYSSSPRIQAMVSAFNAELDPTNDFNNFYNDIMNLATAQGIGLDIWGRIVGVTRLLQVTSAKFFGFDEATNVSADPFGQSPFYSGTTNTSNYALTDSAFRTLIYAKATSNISDGSIPAINALLLQLFPGRGNCYVIDGLNMSLVYHFNFLLTPVEAAIVSQSGILPKAAGVAATVVQV